MLRSLPADFTASLLWSRFTPSGQRAADELHASPLLIDGFPLAELPTLPEVTGLAVERFMVRYGFTPTLHYHR